MEIFCTPPVLPVWGRGLQIICKRVHPTHAGVATAAPNEFNPVLGPNPTALMKTKASFGFPQLQTALNELTPIFCQKGEFQMREWLKKSNCLVRGK